MELLLGDYLSLTQQIVRSNFETSMMRMLTPSYHLHTLVLTEVQIMIVAAAIDKKIGDHVVAELCDCNLETV